jgi:hypothetical protein
MTDSKQNFKLLNYIEESRRPGVALAFILPILITYEIGVNIINIDRKTHTVNGADAILKEAFQALGFYGSLLSALCIIITLTFLHLRKNYSWHIRPLTVLIMLVESFLVALPLFALDKIVKSTILAMGSKGATIGETIILSLGAGVYEEYLFRLILLGGCVYLFTKIFHKHKSAVQIICVLLVSVLFAIFHHLGPIGDHFELSIFAFRTLAGIYFSWIFLARGIGIAVGCHTLYDLMVVGLTLWQHFSHMS